MNLQIVTLDDECRTDIELHLTYGGSGHLVLIIFRSFSWRIVLVGLPLISEGSIGNDDGWKHSTLQ